MSRRNKQYSVPGLEIVDTSAKGKGIGKKDGQVIFVDGTVPGDIVDAWVYTREKKIPVARIDKMIQPSGDRIEAKCKHFGVCGGCKWQSLSYDKQLYYKEKHVRDAIERIAKVGTNEFLPILRCENPFEYRNKVEFTFSNKEWVPREVIDSGVELKKDGGLGFHVTGFFDKVVDIQKCHLHRPVINEIRNTIRTYAIENKLSFFDIREHKGYFRNLLFRTSEGSGELMLMAIIGENDGGPAKKMFEYLEPKFPEITSFLWLVNEKQNSSFSDLEPHVWRGPEFITENLGNWKYRISPTSFFQTNTRQAERLYNVVKEYAGEKAGVIYDLYCGAGSIGIFLSDLAEKVIGVEYVQSAVDDAIENCKMNDLNHFLFYSGDMKKILSREFVMENGAPDLIVTDPPRAGMDPKVVDQLLEIAAPRIIYVSCNPATQARDIALLSSKYKVLKVQPVDMFPQTTHVESIALLEIIL